MNLNRASYPWIHRLFSRLQWGREGSLIMAIVPALCCAAPLARKTPFGIDHPMHLFKAWHFWTEMLGRGRLRGWSHFIGFGIPTNELVPCGSDAWVALFRIATFGQLSWPRTYALAFAAFLVFVGFAAYSFARLYFGRGAAVAAAWITTLDPGQMLQGGWEWHTHYGVWPVSLSMAFSLMALVRLEHVLRGGPARHVFWAGAWVAAALLTHPLALLVFAIATPLLLLEHAVASRAPRPPRVFAVMGALAFGLSLAAFYVVPVLTHASDTQDLGWLGDGLSQVSQRLVEFKTFDRVWAPVHALALLGAFFAISSRRPGGLFVTLAAGVFVLLGSDTLVNDLHLERAFPSINKIEATRMLLVAKSFWFSLAGYALVVLARFAATTAAPMQPSRRWVAVGSTLAIAAVLLVAGWPKFYETQIRKDIQGENEIPFWQDWQAFFAWSREMRTRSNEPYRIAYQIYRNSHLSTVAPVFNQTAVHKVGYTPVEIFNKFPMTDEDPLLEALGVKYVMSEYELDNPKLVLDRQFGALFVYRMTSYRPEPFTVLGEGRGELLEFAPERIRVRLSGTNQDTRLKIHVASYPRWRATIAGREVPISTVTVDGPTHPVLMEVPATDGELVLEYVMLPADWLGLLMSLAAVPVFVLFALVRGRRRGIDVFVVDLERRLFTDPWAAVVVVVLLVVVVAMRVRARDVPLPVSSIFHRLYGGALTLDEHPCTRVKDAQFQCGPKAVSADVVMGGVWGVHYCMTSPGGAELRVRTNLKLGRFLAGSYDPPREGEGAIEVSVGGQNLGSLLTRPAYERQQFIQFDTRAWSGREVPVVLKLDGAALHCFDFRVID